MRRNRLTARLATALVAAPVVAVAITGGTAEQAAAPAEPVLQTFPLTEGSREAVTVRRSMRLVAGTAGSRTAELARRTTEPFSLVGVTWSDPKAVPAGAIEVRTRVAATGRWTSWQRLETDNPDASAGAGGPHVRGASDPLWVGPSDGVQARVTAPGGITGLRVDLINPDARDTTPASGPTTPVLVAGRAADREQRAGVALPLRPVPRMVTRVGWRADESIVEEPPEYTGAVHVVFVHHTATGNSYGCAQSAGIVRGIEAYHVKSKGWNDIGYNFLVDKCGRIFEGRAGGVNRSVLGAHTLGFNKNASAVAVIGDYGSAAVPARARAAVAQVAAYKLGAWRNSPLGRVRLVSTGSDRYPAGRAAVLNRISGHRDTGRTECPGNSLYALLPSIRRMAGAAPSGLRYRGVGQALRRVGRYYTKGTAGPAWVLDTPSQMLDRFEVWVDGRLRTAVPGGHRQAAVRLTPGEHTVTVKAVHLSGRTATTSAKIVADAVAPVFTRAPLVSLREGAVGTTAPVRVDWGLRDASGLRSVRISGKTLTGAARRITGAVRLGAPRTWSVNVTDSAGNTKNGAITRTPVLSTEAGTPRTGTWRTVRNHGHLGGAAVAASAAGSSLTWRFTGSSAALVAARTATSGRIRVYVDGAFQGVVDLRSGDTQYRRSVWTRTWRTSGTHTVQVRAEGTAGRPSVVLDGLVYLR
ncbi:N-acetylmuramoyl-L-alanine amidase [Actinoplanes flavus]|uniref:N-acetylmuramoyl-L-alanine amidase n=1 Tax=Actinoplanes flavus TaxID=2820290 RepID=A0ABS3UUH0_9ACTN|nr:N-acetylmuramoyl-L-alanine amidase [Actinoplanes flavus]MBO3742210.1 N-acetylmuramoyl-L-alanine amidase [Actinoplanes flavus]